MRKTMEKIWENAEDMLKAGCIVLKIGLFGFCEEAAMPGLEADSLAKI